MPKNPMICLICLLLGSVLHLSAIDKDCKTKQTEKITIGSGGGFTGQTKEYILSKDGSVFIKQGEKEAREFGKISKKTWRELTKKSEGSDLQNLNLNEPGNFYYYIELSGKGKTHRVTWSNQSGENGKKMQELYNYIMEVVSKSKNTN